jgi:hypothetical protein
LRRSATQKLGILGFKLGLYLVVEGADNDLIHILGVLLQGVIKNLTSLITVFTFVFDLNDKFEVGLFLIKLAEKLVNGCYLQTC